jgi:hypothetical protein
MPSRSTNKIWMWATLGIVLGCGRTPFEETLGSGGGSGGTTGTGAAAGRGSGGAQAGNGAAGGSDPGGSGGSGAAGGTAGFPIGGAFAGSAGGPVGGMPVGGFGGAPIPVGGSDGAVLRVVPPTLDLTPGQSGKLQALLFSPSQGILDVTAQSIWYSLDPRVAFVSNDGMTQGVVTGRSPGGTSIIANFAGLEDRSVVQVSVKPGVLQLIVTPPEGKVPVGQAAFFAALALGPDGRTTDVTAMTGWRSSDPRIARVLQGVALCLAAGTVQILARYQNVEASATLYCAGGAGDPGNTGAM